MKEIGKYKIIRKIGTGGMATVYLVQDKLMQKYFAMKILHPQFTENERIRQRFIQEARLQISLNHPNIIRCYDVDYQEDYYYILLEYVPGLSLSDILVERQRPFPLDINIAIFIQVLAAMDYAHHQNVVHRDIKPHNIIIANSSGDLKATDVVKIGDFGIAKAFGDDSHTRTGSRLGTLQYMSPEQIVDSSKVDFRSDIYGLGVTFYQLLTGRLPYRDTTNELSLMESIIKERVKIPPQLKNNYPSWVSTVIEKATEKEPEKRFQSCKSFLQAIQDGLNREQNNSSKGRPDMGNSAKTPIPITKPLPEVKKKTTAKPKKSGYMPLVIIGGILILLGVLFALKGLLPSSVNMKDYTGKNVSYALSDLYGQGIDNVHVLKQISYSQPSGRVLACIPEAGVSLTNGKQVILTLSYNPQGTNRFASYFTKGANRFLNEKQIILYNLVFFDTFDGKIKDWRPLDKNPDNFSVQQTHGYFLVKKKNGKKPLLIDYPGPSVKNFILRTDIAKLSSNPSPENGIYYMDNSNILNLLIDLRRQKYFAGFLKYGIWAGQWKTEKSIKPNFTNYLEMVVFQGKAYFFVNGKLEKTMSGAEIFKNGRIGLMVNSADIPVAFDNVVLCGII